MKLIVGLGNPGDKYESTRHNIGFMVVDRIAKDISSVDKKWQFDTSFKAEIFKQNDLILVKPQTFMNASGVAVNKLINFYKIEIADLWVVHDDIDLPLGKIRIKKGGGTAGHHGIESVIKETGSSDFIRFRLGVGKGQHEHGTDADHHLKRQGVEKFVVSPFLPNEEGSVRKLVKHAAEALGIALDKGLEKAMNQYN